MSGVAANIKALKALKLVIAIGENPGQNPGALVKLDPMADRQVREAIAALEPLVSRVKPDRSDMGLDSGYLVDSESGLRVRASWRCRTQVCPDPYLAAVEDDGTCICCCGHVN